MPIPHQSRRADRRTSWRTAYRLNNSTLWEWIGITMLEARHVTLSRGGKTLLEDASFLIGRGEKVGLVGVNGAGKTTLLRALHGDDAPDTGSITRPKRVGYLGQE